MVQPWIRRAVELQAEEEVVKKQKKKTLWWLRPKLKQARTKQGALVHFEDYELSSPGSCFGQLATAVHSAGQTDGLAPRARVSSADRSRAKSQKRLVHQVANRRRWGGGPMM